MNFVLDIETIPRDLGQESRKLQEYIWERGDEYFFGSKHFAGETARSGTASTSFSPTRGRPTMSRFAGRSSVTWRSGRSSVA